MHKLSHSLKLIVFFTFATISFVLLSTPLAHAGGAVGDGGDGSTCPHGGCTGAWSYNGFGWYNYPVSGGKYPQGFHSNWTWTDVSALCQAAGADRVIAFIALTVPGTNASYGVVYNDTGWSTSWTGYNGDAGGGWMTRSDAKAMYDTVDDVYKTGYTWGTNVGWFCYDSTPTPPS